MKYYKLMPKQHLGDAWCLLSQILTYNEDAVLFSTDQTKLNYFKFLYDFFDTNVKIEFKESNEGNEYKNICKHPSLVSHKYISTKIKLNNINSNKITYNFDCNWRVDEKVASNINDLSKHINMTKVGLPMDLENTIKELSTSKCFIAADNGIAHVARSVGVPVIFIEHLYPMENGHPQKYSNFKLIKWTSLEETVKKITSQLSA